MDGPMSPDQELRTMLLLAPKDGPYPSAEVMMRAKEIMAQEAADRGVRACIWPTEDWPGWSGDNVIDLETCFELLALYRRILRGVNREAMEQRQRAESLTGRLEQAVQELKRIGDGGAE